MRIVTPNLTQGVFDAVACHIREHRLQSGDPLPSEAALSALVGVSRTVVREAFGAMSALKLIDVGTGRRARVGKIDGSVIGVPVSHAVDTAQMTVAQVWDARRVLERRATELAALQRTPAEAEAIISHAQAMRHAGEDLAAQTEHDIAFHCAIAEATRNPVFALLVGSFTGIMRQTCPIGWRSRRTKADRLAVFDQHDRVAEAISIGNPAAAEAAMNAHFEISLRALNIAGFH